MIGTIFATVSAASRVIPASLTFGLGGFLDRVELPADILQPLLQLLPLLQGQLLLRLADVVLLGCRRWEKERGEFWRTG